MSFIVIFSRILHITFFSSADSAPTVWSQGIILSHITLLVFWIGVFFIVYRLKDRPQVNKTINALQYIVATVTMASGVIIATIDQLVTNNITPFLLVSIVVGAIFLIRPLISVLIYSTSYLVYYHLIALTITDQHVLLSNRVNGTTAVGIGLLISVVVWHYNYINITQKRHIHTQQKQLTRMAYYDQLTNLYNRHFFYEVIRKELSFIKRYGHESTILILDIDNFKGINDTFGHLVGDQVLKQLAQLLLDNVRNTDTVSRFGGEEFIILAPRISIEKGFELAEKLRQIIAKTPFETGPVTSYITASFGVSMLQETEKEGLHNHFSVADNALYLAKERGKNRVEKLSRV